MVGTEFTAWNVTTYLGLCFFSIALLVFLNSTQPFVLQDILKVHGEIGRLAGTLAFADESVSMILCPLWGTLSDKIGTRPVASISFIVTGTALTLYTTGKTFFPDLLFLRMFFAIGAAASVAMITAILAEVSDFDLSSLFKRRSRTSRLLFNDSNSVYSNHYSPLIHPEPPLLMTERQNGKLVGLVGLSSGLGALASVSLLLPLPTLLYKDEPVKALKTSYYIVGGIGLLIGVLMFIGLHKDRTKSIGWIIGRPSTQVSVVDQAALNLETQQSQPSYCQLLKQGFTIASQDQHVALGYAGGFVARSASIVTTLFIPLYVRSLGIEGHDAYIQAAILSGMANLFVLIFAPVWGYLSDAIGRSCTLILCSVCGFIGSVGIGCTDNPRSAGAYVFASFLGAGQIGAIVTSMSLCTDLKRSFSGSIAGVYSFFGGLGILCITLIGGHLADVHYGLPFFLLATFYVMLVCTALWTIRSTARNIELP